MNGRKEMVFNPDRVLFCDSIGSNEYLIYKRGSTYTLYKLYHVGEDAILESNSYEQCLKYFSELSGRNNYQNAPI